MATVVLGDDLVAITVRVGADDAGAELLGIELRSPSLEDVFLELTGRPWTAADSPGEPS